jgi:hypothetical protein
MTPESWSVVTVAAAFLLVGIACSPLAWVALHNQRSRTHEHIERRLLELVVQVGSLEARLGQSDGFKQARTGNGEPAPSRAMGSWRSAASQPSNGARRENTPATATDSPLEPALIAVPILAGAPNDREASVSGLTERYAAIWALADNGGSPEVIARATGQPIGQIDLILGLRRQIDGARTIIPHAAHG